MWEGIVGSCNSAAVVQRFDEFTYSYNMKTYAESRFIENDTFNCDVVMECHAGVFAAGGRVC